MRRILKTILRAVAITLVVAIAWGGGYINRRGFTREWRQYVNSEFGKHGLSVSINRLTLDPFHGLIARDVQINTTTGTKFPVAVISQVVLDVDYSHLLQHKPFLKGVDLRNTKLTLPVNPMDPASPRVEISNLNARVLISQGLFDLTKADANIYGLHVTMKGNVANPEAFHFSAGGAHGKVADVKWLGDLLNNIVSLRFEGGSPQLDIEFNGDAADLKSFFVQATFHGEKIQSGNYMLDSLDAVANYQNGTINLQRCVAGDSRPGNSRGGTLDASGEWDTSTGAGELRLHSTLDIQKVSHAFGLWPALDDFTFRDAPDVEISARRNAQNSPPFTVTGHVAFGGFSFKTEHFNSFNANFAWDGDRWFARDVVLTHPSGTLTAKAMLVPGNLPGDFRVDAQSTLNLNFLKQILSGKAADTFAQIEFIDPPHVQNLTVRGPSLDFDQCVVTAQLQLGQTSLRHSRFDSAQCNLFIKDRAVSYQNLTITRGEGVATGAFTYDFAKHEIRLDKIKSTLLPSEVAPWLDNPDMPRYVAPYRFKGHPNLSINGVVQFAGGKNTSLEILVDAPQGMDYTFIKKNLSASSISGRLLFTDGHLSLQNVNAAIFDGRMQGGAEIPLGSGPSGYSANVTVKNVNFEKLTKLYFDYDNSHGELNGSYTFTGRGDDARNMQGEGQVTVTNGNVFAIPFLGPFTSIMNSLVPGLGYDVARKASADFHIANGAIDIPSRTFAVQGRGFNMLGGGKIYFLDDSMDFDIRLNASGLMGVLVNPVGKLFEYTSQGSLSNPVWRPKRLPKL
ncbi:MAG TPA: AsmA-like C-terminal region-containing protein [Chthoniobacteraceae bacterium]|nr:AsmA-like C-terminal region-containing protein [Chthoniobacteraceae bacterium]